MRRQPKRKMLIELVIELINLAQRSNERTVAERLYQHYIMKKNYIGTFTALTFDVVSILYKQAREFEDSKVLKDIEQVITLRSKMI